MARPQSIISIALFISLLAVAIATTTITTTTTTIIDDDSSIINSKCKYVDVQKINHCKMYLTPDPSGVKNAQTTHLTECCNQLAEVETKCRCMGIKEVLWNLKNQKSMSGKSLWESEEVERMEQDAQDLPTRCGVELKEPCTIVQPVLNFSKI
ncbi:AAI domain-containing protein [Heracleum sosnowskyi]|uniref:AAI domain-containing protein n=1 Tax=Heracleum sosnowskyi TaxID=360622 RepID=A0AAD8IVZ9_9APIA|nr:AAI domain-containing protein [Heracleum sosnowskyi]